MKKKIMTVVEDKKQKRVGIPKEFVKEFKITKKDKVEWNNRKGKLKAELKKNE